MDSNKRKRDLDMSDHRNWKVAKLRAELDKAAIKTAPNFSLSVLRKLYVSNVLGNAVQSRLPDSSTTRVMDATAAASGHSGGASHNANYDGPGRAEGRDLEITTPINESRASGSRGVISENFCPDTSDRSGDRHLGQIDSTRRNTSASATTGHVTTTSANLTASDAQTGMSTMAPMLSLAQTMIEKMAILIQHGSKSEETEPAHDLTTYYTSSITTTASGNFGTAPGDLPYMDLVTPALRKNIIAGKDVNLASLLVSPIDLDRNDDNRLNRNLTISEFITAFGRYKRIMSSVFPHRREELDQYEGQIVHIYNTYGQVFYDYHKMFSLNSANALHVHNTKVDWSKKDLDLLHMVTAGDRNESITQSQSFTNSTIY